MLFGDMELLESVINKWRLTLSVLPENDKKEFLQNLSLAMGIETDLLK